MTNSFQSLIRKPIEHDLKIWSRHFEDVISGRKKAEHRVNDRDFQVGDTLLLREVTEPECEYTGRKTYVTITHIIRGGEMDILSIEPQDTKGVCSEIRYISPDGRKDLEEMIADKLEATTPIKHECRTNYMCAAHHVMEVIRPYLRTTEPVYTQKYVEDITAQRFADGKRLGVIETEERLRKPVSVIDIQDKVKTYRDVYDAGDAAFVELLEFIFEAAGVPYHE